MLYECLCESMLNRLRARRNFNAERLRGGKSEARADLISLFVSPARLLNES